MLSLFLIACGGGKEDSDQVPATQITIKTADIDLEKVSIDLNQKKSADVVLTRIFDDESETTLNLVISWGDGKLVLKDEAGNVIQLNYNDDLLTVGETDIKFTDPESKLDVEFLIELIPEQSEPSLTEVSLSLEKLTIDLNMSVTSSTNLVSKFDDNTEISDQLTFSWIKESGSLTLKNSSNTVIDLDYDSASLNTSSIPVTFIDPLSNVELSIEIVIVDEIVDPVELSIKKYVLTPNKVELSTDDEIVLSLSVIMSDDSQGVVPDDVICLLDAASGVISVTPNCKVTALQAGEVNVTVSRTEAISDSLVQKASVTVVSRSEPVVTITKVEINEKSPTLIEGLDLPLSFNVTYSNGKIEGNQFDKVECRSSSSLISITSNCVVTAISSGKAKIDLIMLTGDTPILIGSEIEITPTEIIKVEIDAHDPILVEGLELSLPLSVYYSNGVVKKNEFTDVKCISDSDFISITPTCNVTAISPGLAPISLELLVGGDPRLTGSQITIIPLAIKEVNVTPVAPRLSIGDVRSLKVIADYNNNTSVDVTAKSTCSLNTGNTVISLSNVCVIEALQNGSAEISVSVNEVTTIEPVLVSVTVSDGLVLDSGEYIILDVDYFGGDANTRVSCDQDFLLGVESNCEIFAYFPGEHEITATLKNITTGEFIRTVKRTVVVNAVPLGDFSQESDFTFLVSPNIYAIVFEINNVTMNNVYKITLSDNLLPPNIKLGVLSDLLISKLTCANTVSAAASIAGRVACGIEVSSDKIYVSLEDLNASEGLSGMISVVPDTDILQFAGPLKAGGDSNVAYIDAYEFAPITIGQTFVDGHVPANLEGLNVSRYYSDIELGMNPAANAGNFYTVTVTFEPPNSVGLANFDLQSVRIRWYGGTQEGDPDLQCLPQYDVVKTNTLSCTFDNIGQDHVFVEVHGNGADNLGLSNVTAVDGEITYSINISQVP